MSGELPGDRNRGLTRVKRRFMNDVWTNGFGVRKTKMKGPHHLAKKVKTRFYRSKLTIDEAEYLVGLWMTDLYGEDYYVEARSKETKTK